MKYEEGEVRQENLRKDLYKMLSGLEDTDSKRFFDLVDLEPTRVTRHTTNQLNLKQGSFQTELRKHAFAIRVPKMWNELPNQVREARTLNLFKNRYDDHWRQARMK